MGWEGCERRIGKEEEDAWDWGVSKTWRRDHCRREGVKERKGGSEEMEGGKMHAQVKRGQPTPFFIA